MAAIAFFKRLAQGLSALGARRLAALGLAGVTVFVLVGVCGYYLSRPPRDILYTGLDPQDVMLNLEKSYQASAKIVSAVDRLLQSLMDAVN